MCCWHRYSCFSRIASSAAKTCSASEPGSGARDQRYASQQRRRGEDGGGSNVLMSRCVCVCVCAISGGAHQTPAFFLSESRRKAPPARLAFAASPGPPCRRASQLRAHSACARAAHPAVSWRARRAARPPSRSTSRHPASAATRAPRRLRLAPTWRRMRRSPRRALHCARCGAGLCCRPVSACMRAVAPLPSRRQPVWALHSFTRGQKAGGCAIGLDRARRAGLVAFGGGPKECRASRQTRRRRAVRKRKAGAGGPRAKPRALAAALSSSARSARAK